MFNFIKSFHIDTDINGRQRCRAGVCTPSAGETATASDRGDAGRAYSSAKGTDLTLSHENLIRHASTVCPH